MKMASKAAAVAIMSCVALSAFGDGVFGVPVAPPIYQDASNPDGTWSGSMTDLEALVEQAKANYGFENSKHLGRNATMLVPATLDEMKREIKRGNTAGWDTTFWDGAHAKNADSDDGSVAWAMKSFGSGVVKYINPHGDEVVYDAQTGKIIQNEKLGTKNFNADNTLFSSLWGEHQQLDMTPHKTKASSNNPMERDGDQYKYVGILYERDPNNSDRCYLVDGQTGKRMTKRQAEEFPTTLSDMWKEQGLACVANDAVDLVQPAVSPENATSFVGSGAMSPSQTSSGTVKGGPATQTMPADIAAMAGQLANEVGSIQSRQHACTSFEFVKDYLDARKQPYQKLYRCTECGKETIVDARGGETIEDKIAQNKQRAALTGQAYGFAQGALQAMPGAMAAQNGAGCATPDAGVADILNEHGLMAGSALLCTMTERGEGPLAHYNTKPTQENP